MSAFPAGLVTVSHQAESRRPQPRAAPRISSKSACWQAELGGEARGWSAGGQARILRSGLASFCVIRVGLIIPIRMGVDAPIVSRPPRTPVPAGRPAPVPTASATLRAQALTRLTPGVP